MQAHINYGIISLISTHIKLLIGGLSLANGSNTNDQN